MGRHASAHRMPGQMGCSPQLSGRARSLCSGVTAPALQLPGWSVEQEVCEVRGAVCLHPHLLQPPQVAQQRQQRLARLVQLDRAAAAQVALQ